MPLYTKQGDDGKTGLIGGQRVAKDHPRVAAYGTVDETNAAIGSALAACEDELLAGALREIQSELFTLGSELATHTGATPPLQITAEQVARLERLIDEAEAVPPSLKNFILPGGTELACRLHVARGACRRAERAVVRLSQTETVSQPAIVYLNRLGDLLFALARLANHRAGVADVPWIAPDPADA